MVLLETTNGMEALPKEAALTVDRPVIEVAAHTGHQVEVPEAILRAEVLEVINHLVVLRPEAVDTAALEEVHGVQAATAVRLQEAAQEARAAIEDFIDHALAARTQAGEGGLTGAVVTIEAQHGLVAAVELQGCGAPGGARRALGETSRAPRRLPTGDVSTYYSKP